MRTYRKCILLFIITGMILISSFNINLGAKYQDIPRQGPTPPTQPPDGPGGANYSYQTIIKTRYNRGPQQYWIFEPADPTPYSAPVIIFNHGWIALFPIIYQAWIDHLVKRGNIVIYPRYQRGVFFGFTKYYDNAVTAVKEAIEELQSGLHVSPDLTRVAITGHSLGGGFTAMMAAEAELHGLPAPKAIMPVQPGIHSSETINYSKISNETLMLVIVGEDDTVVEDIAGKQIFYGADQIPLDRKDFIIQKTDTYGEPPLLADHLAPVAIHSLQSPTVDAMDFYSTWKLFDALTDYAFYGINQEYCLGNTSEQRFMGLWSDGTPVKELVVTDTP